MTRRKEVGNFGEDLATEYLINKTYKIIGRNIRDKWGELDVLAIAPDKTLVFVEVKTMTNNYSVRPEDQMSPSKIKKFKKSAYFYANQHNELINDKKGWRLDVIAITLSDKENNQIVHYENI